MVRLVIFDHSGVLINDLRESWQCISKIVGLRELRPDDLKAFRRNFCLPYWKYLISKGFSEREAKSEGVVNDYIRFYTELIDHVNLFDDVEYTLKALVERNIELAMVSHSPRRVIDMVTEKLGLLRFFRPNSIFGLGDYKRQKPHPESIELALNRLAYDAGDALYVGDMSEDIEAARRAHVKSVAIYRENGSYHIEPYLRNANPTFIIKDLRELLPIVDGRP
jgi:HAD superfamily hydrolase (TIGR01549 family)